MKQIDRDNFELSTGRKIYANQGIFGLNNILDDIYNGYDGHLSIVSFDYEIENDVVNYSAEEIAEICDYMIDLWSQMKEKFYKV